MLFLTTCGMILHKMLYMSATGQWVAFNKLPENARRYVEFLSAQIGTEIGLISTGPERDQTIILKDSVMESWFL